MGGFNVRVLETKASKELMIPDEPTVTPKGVLFLATHKRAPEVDSDAIRDKSKSDSLAKGLVCIQAGWILIQTIARKADGLPVTLLEVNTVAHVVAAVLYVLILVVQTAKCQRS